ncbi:MAG: PAS domain S-box protein [Theionarchaea archaeon]|nr:PAS domain S-box protein [Theionarchaea archaeon]
MNIYAGSSLLVSYIILLLGTYIYQKDPKNELNRMFTVFCVLLGYLAFTEFGYRQAVDADTAYIWLKAAFVWPFVLPLFVHLILIFTKKVTFLKKKLVYVLLYGPAFLFSALEVTTDLLSGGYQKMYWGWTYTIPEERLLYSIHIVWIIMLAVLSLLLLLQYCYETEEPAEKQRATYVLVGVSIPAIIVSVTDVVLPLINIRVPETAVPAVALGVVFTVYGMWKYKLFILTPAVAAEDIVASMSNILFLVKKDGTVSLANQAALDLLGYQKSELVGQPLSCIVTEQEWRKIQDQLHSLAEKPFIRNRETTVVTKEGKLTPVLLSVSVIRDKYGNNLGMTCVGSDLTDHRKAEEAQRKEVLLKEIHHRVKNNMQIMSSLLSLQSEYITDEQYKEMFKDSQNRIKSMALVHEKLYQSKTLEHINVREYIADMVNRLVRSYPQDITVTMEVDDVSIGVDTAVPCGLIINELVTNALKHAFSGEKGEIIVGFHKSDGEIELQVADNGVGIPDTIDFRTTETLGLQLVTILAEDQLDGTVQLTRNKGTAFCINFKSEQDAL